MTTDERPEVVALLARMKERLPEARRLLSEAQDHWGGEDGVYRFYHGSFKVYHLQDLTKKILDFLGQLGQVENEIFLKICREGTSRVWNHSHNRRWMKETRPIVEAFFHAEHMLAMIVKYGEELESPPAVLASGWATVLYLYGLR
jgi:hypothetical protein